MKLPRTCDLFDLTHTLAAPYLAKTEFPWEILPDLKDILLAIGAELPEEEYLHPSDDVWIHKTAKVFPSAYIGGPAIICEGAEIRHCAFIRGTALVGKGAVVGNSTELKNALLFDAVQVPHYNYVGDSVYGFKAHTGAGVIASNVKSDKKNIVVQTDSEACETGQRKLGAILGDFADIGCNSVLCPGSVVGTHSRVYPLTRVRGVIPPDSIVKDEKTIVPILP